MQPIAAAFSCPLIWTSKLLPHRTWATQRQIIKAVLREGHAEPLDSFDLSDEEILSYKRLALKVETQVIRKASTLKSYDPLVQSRPFAPVAFLVLIIATVSAISIALMLRAAYIDDFQTYPLFAASATMAAVAAAAVGWGVAGWVAHRNARIQHTITIISTRFSQPAFSQNLVVFNINFGEAGLPKVTSERIRELASSQEEDDHKAVLAAKNVLNYFEFISAGVVSGDLDLRIVTKNLRANMIHYYDKCEPYVSDLRRRSPTILEHYARLRSHFREP